MSRMKFLNTHIDNLTMKEAVNRIDELITQLSQDKSDSFSLI